MLDRVCLFTDHLSGFSYAEVARMLRELKVTGPDLTVRPGGLVLPERVETDLAQAAEAFRDQGLTIPMITTGITSAGDPLARAILATAHGLGIRYFKLGYFPYQDQDRWRETLERTRVELIGIAKAAAEFNMVAGFHNHSGPFVGGALWDVWEILQSVPQEYIGAYFDPAQATIEGGGNGWQLNLRRASERLKMIAIKDYLWEKSERGWRHRWVPLGQGMVNWPQVIPLLKRMQWPGPVSLHIEYDPGGITKTERYDRSLAAAARDFGVLRKLVAG